MSALSPAAHRTIVCVDVERFGDRRRTNAHQIAIRDGLYGALYQAFASSGVRWQDCYHEDRGDGVLVLVPPQVPKSLLVTGVLAELATALSEHNRAHDRQARIRLRLAVHAGEVHHDEHGVVGTAINMAFRMLAAEALKRALDGSLGVLAVIASQWFYEEVIRHTPDSMPASYRRVRISVKETQATAWISLPDDPYPAEEDAALPSAPMVAVPRQLPCGVASFAGRTAELEILTGLLEVSAGHGGTVVISAIDGTAGIGKTAVAVHWAHQVADRFPDGQLFVNLRGFEPTVSAMTPAEAVRGFLDAFEVPPERIPVSLEAQAALYRSVLAGRRVLVVLDNARDADQVRPLLPAGPGSLVVVTSRSRLTSLIAVEGAAPLTLDVLPTTEARQLLFSRLGTERATAEPHAVDEIIDSCARLPLALSVAAARATTHPRFSLAALADELRNARSGLDAFDGGDLATNVRAVFSWSYQRLSVQAARLFRLLGLHPGPDVATPAAASMAGLPVQQTRRVLAELARGHLVEEHTPGRFGFHDLLRAYATELAYAQDPEAERCTAVHRMLDHYLHTAHTAAMLLYPRLDPLILTAPLSGVTPEELVDYGSAWAWFEAEHPVMLKAIQLTATTRQDTHAWQLPWTLVDYFERRGHWHAWAAAQHTALTAAQRQVNRSGQAHAHRGLGRACAWLGRYEEANTHFRQALALFEELSDKVGQAHTYIALSWMIACQDRPREALPHTRQALALFRAVGNRRGQAQALNNVGWQHAQFGDHQLALTCCEQALALYRECGDRRGESHTLDSLGYAHHHLGHYEQAAVCYQQSLALRRELGERHGLATVLTHLGDTQHAAYDPDAARATWQHALNIADELGLCCADQLRARLRRLGDDAHDDDSTDDGSVQTARAGRLSSSRPGS